jgi:hypothetical protein
MTPGRESWTHPTRRGPGSAPEPAGGEDGPSVLAMVGAVAAIVALVILVFFAIGYLFGRLFL